MKKFLSICLALAMILALGTVAFAGPSQGPKQPETEPKVVSVVDAAGEAVTVVIIDYADAEKKLSAEDMAIMEEAYLAASSVEDAVCEYFFWITADEGAFPIAYTFVSENEVVSVTLNGEEIECTASDLAENAYTAIIPGPGAIAIYTAIAE